MKKKKIPNYYAFDPSGYRLTLVGENIKVYAHYCPKTRTICTDVTCLSNGYMCFENEFTANADSLWTEEEVELACRSLLEEWEAKYDPERFDDDWSYYQELSMDQELFPWENCE